MTGSVTGIRRRRGVAGRRETPHLPLDRDFYGQTLHTECLICFMSGICGCCSGRGAQCEKNFFTMGPDPHSIQYKYFDMDKSIQAALELKLED